MAKAFNGAIKLASTISQTGAQPLDDRSVVANVSDLYNSFGSAIYNGMAVTVQATGTIFILLDKTKVNLAEGWKEVGSDIKVALTAGNYTAAMGMATGNNIGQIINVTEDETLEDNTYTAGLYVVTGTGAVAKLGTTSASGDLSGDVEKLKGDVSTLKETVTKLNGDETVDGSVKKQIKDAKDALETEIGNVKKAHTVVSGATGNTHVTVETTNGDSGEQRVTITENDIASKTELDALSDKVGNEASGDTGATGVFKYVDDKVGTIKVPEYSIEKDTNGVFHLTKDTANVGESISFKDYMVRSGSVVIGDWTDTGKTTFNESETGKTTAIKLVLNVKDAKGEDASETIYIDATSLVDTYTVAEKNEDYLKIDGYTISIGDTAKTNIDNVPTIESGLTALSGTVTTLQSDALTSVKVNNKTLDKTTKEIALTGKDIKTDSDIKDGEDVIVSANTAVDTVLSGIYSRIKELDGTKVASVTAKEKSGVVVTTTDNKAEVSLDLETATDTTVADGRIEIKADKNTGKLYGVMYYNEGIPEKTTPENTTEEK